MLAKVCSSDKMPKPIRFVFFLLFTFAVAALLSACSLLPGNKNEEPVTLEYWGLWSSQTAIDTVINDYKKIKPNVNISYKKRTPQQYRETLENQIQTGKGPDIFRFHNTWTPMLKEELDPVPSDVVPQTDFKKNFYPVVFADLRVGGKFVGVPLEYDGLALYYNEEVFKAAGIAAAPATWTEFAEDAAKLTVKDSAGNIRTAGAALGTAGNVDHFSDILALMILQNGGDLKSPTDKQSADALEYYSSFAKGSNRVWDETMPSSTVAFAGGNLAMYFAPSWRAIELRNANPLLKFRVAPVPQLEGGNVSWATYWVEGVSSKSTHKKEAWEFIKYLQSEEVLIKLYSESAKSPGRFFGEPYPKVSMASKLASDPILGAYMSDAPFARSFPLASRTFDNGLNDQSIKAYEDAVNAVAKGTQAAKALETTANNLNTIFGKFGFN
jgi:multiple sugar transport system substrate-binding protein